MNDMTIPKVNVVGKTHIHPVVQKVIDLIPKVSHADIFYIPYYVSLPEAVLRALDKDDLVEKIALEQAFGKVAPRTNGSVTLDIVWGDPPVHREIVPELAGEQKALYAAVTKYLTSMDIMLQDARGDVPAYNRETDVIQMPRRELFTDDVIFLSTLSHEVIHSTGGKKRLNRNPAPKFDNITDILRELTKPKANKRRGYHIEELVAALGSELLLDHFALSNDRTMRGTAVYIKGYLQDVLGGDASCVVASGFKAMEAMQYVLKGDWS
jgi:hypothetical protein